MIFILRGYLRNAFIPKVRGNFGDWAALPEEGIKEGRLIAHESKFSGNFWGLGAVFIRLHAKLWGY